MTQPVADGTRFVESADGTTIAVQVSGRGRPLVLVHGTSSGCCHLAPGPAVARRARDDVRRRASRPRHERRRTRLLAGRRKRGCRGRGPVRGADSRRAGRPARARVRRQPRLRRGHGLRRPATPGAVRGLACARPGAPHVRRAAARRARRACWREVGPTSCFGATTETSRTSSPMRSSGWRPRRRGRPGWLERVRSCARSGPSQRTSSTRRRRRGSACRCCSWSARRAPTDPGRSRGGGRERCPMRASRC